jgi:hypothetical protein
VDRKIQPCSYGSFVVISEIEFLTLENLACVGVLTGKHLLSVTIGGVYVRGNHTQKWTNKLQNGKLVVSAYFAL